MIKFSGVSRYIMGRTTVENGFPVSLRGVPDVSCYQCRFFRRSSQLCGLTGELTAYPQKYIGAACPLNIEYDDEN